MGAGFVVFLGEAVGGEKLVLHGRTAGGGAFFLAGLGVEVHPVEALELVLVAAAAGGEIEIGRGLGRGIAQMGIQLGMADRTGKACVLPALFQLLDLFVAGKTGGLIHALSGLGLGCRKTRGCPDQGQGHERAYPYPFLHSLRLLYVVISWKEHTPRIQKV